VITIFAWDRWAIYKKKYLWPRGKVGRLLYQPCVSHVVFSPQVAACTRSQQGVVFCMGLAAIHHIHALPGRSSNILMEYPDLPSNNAVIEPTRPAPTTTTFPLLLVSLLVVWSLFAGMILKVRAMRRSNALQKKQTIGLFSQSAACLRYLRRYVLAPLHLR
jgi:hypothetical protein